MEEMGRSVGMKGSERSEGKVMGSRLHRIKNNSFFPSLPSAFNKVKNI